MTVTLNDVLRMEHDVLHDALNEWCGMNDDKAMEDLQYLCGVHDMAHKLIEKLVDEDGGTDD